MGDPLSVAASIVGIIAVAGKCIKMANEFCSTVQDAPKTIAELCEEMQQMQAIVITLQELLNGTRQGKRKKLSQSRSAMISLYNVEATLSGCVLTCDRLNKHLGTALGIVNPRRPEERTGTLLDRLKWAWSKEKEAAEILAQLQRHKSSLILILTIIQCKNDEEAGSSRTMLQDLVLEAIKSDNPAALHLRELIKRHFDQDIDAEFDDEESVQSVTTSSVQVSAMNSFAIAEARTKTEASPIPTSLNPLPSRVDGAASLRSTSSVRSLASELKHSRAYKRAHLWNSKYRKQSGSNSVFSIESRSPSAQEGRWSMLSDLTLGDLTVSQVTVLGLPVHEDDIWDSTTYNFTSNHDSNSGSRRRASLRLSIISTSRGRIHNAISSNNELFVRTLIGLGTDINEIDPESGLTPLIHSALLFRESICKILVENGANFQFNYEAMSQFSLRDFQSHNALYPAHRLLPAIRLAAEHNHVIMFQVLIILCITIVTQTHKTGSAFGRSDLTLSIAEVQELFQDPSILDTASKIRWDTQSTHRLELVGYLHAVWESLTHDWRAVHLLELLLRMGTNIEEKNSEGATVLARALFWNAEEVCELLLARGASVEAVARWYTTRSPLASEDVQKFEVFFKVLRTYSESEFSALYTVFRDANLWSHFDLGRRLHEGIDKYDVASIRILLKLGVDISYPTPEGLTPLAHAALLFSEDICQLLLDYGASIDMLMTCEIAHIIAPVPLEVWFENGAYKFTSKEQYESVIRVLKALNIQSQLDIGQLIHKAISFDKAPVVRFSLDLGANIEFASSQGMTPLAHAAIQFSDDICRLLLEYGASIDAVKSCEIAHIIAPTPIEVWFEVGASRFTLTKQYKSVIRVLEALNIQSQLDLDQLVHKAISLNKGHVVRFSLQLGANIDFVNPQGITPLAHAALRLLEDICRLLLAYGASIDLVKTCDVARAIATVDMKTWLDDAVDRLTSNKRCKSVAHVLKAMNTGLLLHEAISLDKASAVRVLLDVGANIEFANSQRLTPLAHAALRLSEDICQLLLAYGASIDLVKTCDVARTITTVDMKTWLDNVVDRLTNKECEFSPRVLKAMNLGQLLHVAISLDKVSAVRVLLDVGANIELANPQGLTPLVHAAIRFSEDICQALFEHGASLKAVKKNITLIDPVMQTRFEAAIKVLTCLVTQGQYSSVIHIFKAMNTQPHAQLAMGHILYKAISLDKADAVRVLLNLGVSIEYCNIDGYTPLAYAAIKYAENTCGLLLQRSASLSSIQKPQYTALLKRGDLKGLKGVFEYLAKHSVSNDAGLWGCAIVKVLLAMGLDIETMVEFTYIETIDFTYIRSFQIKALPLFIAAAWHPAHHLLPVLIDCRTNLRARDSTRRTILHYLCNPQLLTGFQLRYVFDDKDRDLTRTWSLVLQRLSLPTPLQDRTIESDARGIDSKLEIINWACIEGNTALHECCQPGALYSSSGRESAPVLLKNGADVTIKNKAGYTPFQLALKAEKIGAMRSPIPKILWSAMTADQRAAEQEAIGLEVDLESRFGKAIGLEVDLESIGRAI